MKKFSIWNNAGVQETVEADSATVKKTKAGLTVTFKTGATKQPPMTGIMFVEIAPEIVVR